MAQRGGSMEDLDEYIIASLSGGGWGDLVDDDTSNKYNDDNITVICREDGSCGGNRHRQPSPTDVRLEPLEGSSKTFFFRFKGRENRERTEDPSKCDG
jgi:hypothetical protein